MLLVHAFLPSLSRDLAVGDTLDQIGEYCYRAWIMEAGEARRAGAIPCGLLTGAKVTRPVRKGDLITRANTAVPADSNAAKDEGSSGVARAGVRGRLEAGDAAPKPRKGFK